MIRTPFSRRCRRLLFSFGIGFLLAPCASAHVEQFNQAQCAQLEAALELNREQQRRGYRLKQELKIKAQQTQLELQLQYHCQQPHGPQRPETKMRKRNNRQSTSVSMPGSKASPRQQVSVSSATAKRNLSTTPVQFSLIAVKAPYQGAQLIAWLQFYQPPFYCFGVRHTPRIRQCVEQRQQAQIRFEQQFSAVRPQH